MPEETEIPATGTIDNKLLLSLLRDIRREQRETRQELAALSRYVLDLEKRQSRRYDGLSGQMTEMKDDIEITIKSELSGRLTNFEARIDQKIEELLSK